MDDEASEEPESASRDLLGLKGYGDAKKAQTDAVIDFVERVCGPAADQLGLMLSDQMSYWRASNALRICQKFADRLKTAKGKASVNPRVYLEAIEQGSRTNDDNLQSMWAGLLASSATSDSDSDEDVIFTHLLSRTSSGGAKLLQLLVQKATPENNYAMMSAMWSPGVDIVVDVEELLKTIDSNDRKRLERELYHLCANGLMKFQESMMHMGDFSELKSLYVMVENLAIDLVKRCDG